MDALKLVSTIGNHSTFGNSSSEIHVEEEEDECNTEIQTDTAETDNKKLKKLSVLHPPDGGKLAWRLVGVCTFLSVCQETLRNLIKYSDQFTDDVGTDLVADIIILFDGFSKFGGVFAALLTLRYGYRMVGIIGSFTASVGLLLASLIPNETMAYRNFIAVLVGCVSGIGSGFMGYVILVTVLEYFATKRVKALIITKVGCTLVSLAFTSLLEIKTRNPEIIIPWRHAFKYQGVGMAAAVIVSGLISTLDLEPEPKIRKISHRQPLQYSDFSPKDWNGLLKDLTFYLYAIFFLFYDFAEHLPAIRDITTNQLWAFNYNQITATKYIPYIGFVCATLPMCFWKSQSLSRILAVLGPINFIIGLATCVILPYIDFGLIVFYGIVFVIAKNCILLMLLDVIPDEFGRNNTRITVGIISFIGGICEVGSAYAKESAKNFIAEPTEKFKAVFILSGALVMVSGLFGVFIRCLIVLVKDPDSNRNEDST